MGGGHLQRAVVASPCGRRGMVRACRRRDVEACGVRTARRTARVNCGWYEWGDMVKEQAWEW